MQEKVFLFVEDNPDDEELTLIALKESNILNKVIVARDGVEAPDYRFGTGEYSEKPLSLLPQIVLLNLKLPKVSGLEVLERMRADPYNQYIPVVILTSSSEEEDILSNYKLGANRYVRKPVEFPRFADAV